MYGFRATSLTVSGFGTRMWVIPMESESCSMIRILAYHGDESLTVSPNGAILWESVTHSTG
jgi:hypothetical protein